VIRQLIGMGTPNGLARGSGPLWLFASEVRLLLSLVLPPDAKPETHFPNGRLTDG
jgi:hypothetical protein